MKPENIVCRICYKTHNLTESALCSCGERIYTSQEIRETIADLDRQTAVLRNESLRLSSELWLRERRRTETDARGNYQPNFWLNVVNAPRQAKVKQIISERDLLDFD